MNESIYGDWYIPFNILVRKVLAIIFISLILLQIRLIYPFLHGTITDTVMDCIFLLLISVLN